MRKLVITLLVALAAPAVALGRVDDRGDGTLAVKGASATIQIVARGSILGRIDTGSLTITDWNPNDTTAPQVIGAERTISKTDLTTVYKGKDIRFRFVAGRYTIKLVGTGINLAAVGSGIVRLIGAGSLDDGLYSLDGQPFTIVPIVLTVGGFGEQATSGPPIPIGG